MTNLLIKSIPKEISDFILTEQLRLKIENPKKSFNQSLTMIHIVREYKKLKESK